MLELLEEMIVQNFVDISNLIPLSNYNLKDYVTLHTPTK